MLRSSSESYQQPNQCLEIREGHRALAREIRLRRRGLLADQHVDEQAHIRDVAFAIAVQVTREEGEVTASLVRADVVTTLLRPRRGKSGSAGCSLAGAGSDHVDGASRSLWPPCVPLPRLPLPRLPLSLTACRS